MNLKDIQVEVLPGGFIDCQQDDCPHSRECTNHHTAGDFRMECGAQPTLVKAEDGVIRCQSYYGTEEDFGVGEALLVDDIGVDIKDNGLIVVNEQQGQQFLEHAEQWFVKNGIVPFRSVRSTAISAVAEYLANQSGFTLYTK